MTESTAYAPPTRLQAFTDDEQRQDRLTPLLDGYHITDQGAHELIRRKMSQN